MDIDPKTEKKLQKIISEISNGNITDAMGMTNLTKEESEQFIYLTTMNFLFSQSAKYRGKVIDISIILEMTLARILAKYFTNDEKKETILNSFVFDRMQLSVKFNLLKKILKTQHVKIWTKYQKDLKEINDLIEFRNNLAHSLLDSSEDYINSLKVKALNIAKTKQGDINEIQIGYFENEEFKYEKISKKQVDDYYSNCYKKIALLQRISSEIG